MTIEREKFEAAHKGLIFDKDEYGRYVHHNISMLYDGWQACAEQKPAEIDALRAELEQAKTALKLYINAGFGNSTDFSKQCAAYDAAIEVLK